MTNISKSPTHVCPYKTYRLRQGSLLASVMGSLVNAEQELVPSRSNKGLIPILERRPCIYLLL